MANHKQTLADFYLWLLSFSPDSSFRLINQPLYAHVRDVLAHELDSDPETVQNIFERMASEDKK